MSQPRYIEPTTAMRAKLLAFYVFGALSTVAIQLWLDPLTAWIRKLPSCQMVPWAQGELVFVLAVTGWITYVLLRHGWLVYKHGQTPLPDAWVWTRTRIHTGWRAHCASLFSLGLAALIVAGTIWLLMSTEIYLLLNPDAQSSLASECPVTPAHAP